MDNDAVYIALDPHDVNYVNRILEGYEYLGVLTTLDPRRALCCIHATADTREEVIALLTDLTGLKRPVEFLNAEEIAEAMK